MGSIYQAMLSRSPINFNHEQNKDKTLLATAKGTKHYTLKEFHGGDRSLQLLCYKNRIVIPKGLQMSHAPVVSPHSMPPRNQSNQKKPITLHFYQKKSFPWQMPWSSAHIRCSEI